MKKENSIYYWLLTGCFLIALMVVIGGITRLTQSGLSMVEWKPIVGAIPPLNESEWNHEFELYPK
jgi:heme a synthase